MIQGDPTWQDDISSWHPGNLQLSFHALTPARCNCLFTLEQLFLVHNLSSSKGGHNKVLLLFVLAQPVDSRKQLSKRRGCLCRSPGPLGSRSPEPAAGRQAGPVGGNVWNIPPRQHCLSSAPTTRPPCPARHGSLSSSAPAG